MFSIITQSPKAILVLVSLNVLIVLYTLSQIPYGVFSEAPAEWRPRDDYLHPDRKTASVEKVSSSSPSSTPPPLSRHRIAMIVVVMRLADLSSYTEATATMRCYAGIAGYPLYHLYMDTSHAGRDGVVVNGWNATKAIVYCRANWAERPDFNALMFFRHCLVAEFLYEHEAIYDWVLVMDADIGVVNPQHRIEEWIDDSDEWVSEGVDVGMCHNHQLINKDQSAIHETFMRLYATVDERKKCRSYYFNTDPFPNNEFYTYIACTQHFLNPRATNRTSDGVLYFGGGSLPRVKTLPRFYPAWVRDANKPVTSKWALCDFMLHEWKNVQRRPKPTQPNPFFDPCTPFPWDTPFNESFSANLNFDQCVPERREEVIERYWRQRWLPEMMLANASQLRPNFEAVINGTDAFYATRLAKLPNKGNFSA